MTFTPADPNDGQKRTAQISRSLASLGNRLSFRQLAVVLRPFLILLPLLLAGLSITPASAQENNNGLSLSVTVGYDSFYKGEHWLPVQVMAANSGPSIEGYVEIQVDQGSGLGDATYRSPVSLPTQSNKRVTIYVKLPTLVSDLDVQLVDRDGTLAAEVNSGTLSRIAQNSLLYGVVSPDGGEFTFLENIRGSRGDAAVALLTLDDLPETAVAWQALDILIFNDTDTTQMSTPQRNALEAWLNNGGQLVVTGGAGWQKSASALAELLPVAVNGSQSVDDLPGLRERIGIPFRDPGPYVVATSSLRNGELLFRQDELPLLARQSIGRGSVYFLALDPLLAPLLDWDGSEAIWATVASRVPGTANWRSGPLNSYAATTAVSSLPALTLPNILQLIGFLLIYTVVVGPLNYWVLKRRNQLERAWITIPALVIIFSAVTYFTGFQLRGNDTIINQVSVAYSQADGDQADVYSLLGLYSPQRDIYDLSLPSQTLARPYTQEFGRPFGGNDPNIGAITYDNDVTISDVRVDIGGVSVFLVQGAVPAVELNGSATLTVEGNNLVLEMDLLNNSDVTLETASVLLGSTAVSLGDIAPNERTAVTQVIGSTSSTSSASSPFGSPGYSAPLSANADTILGSFNYYDDRELFPRWQLLQSLESSNFGSGNAFVVPAESVLLLAWSSEQQLSTQLENASFDSQNTTLYIIQIPLQQNLVSGQNVTIPISLLNWEPLANNNVYNPTIQDLYLNGGWVEFSYVPWPEFQNMTVTRLGVSLTQQFEDPSQLVPDLRIWDFEQEIWQPIPDPVWGNNILTEFAPFMGPNNEVRLRLQDNNSQFGLGIGEIYPIYTGNLSE